MLRGRLLQLLPHPQSPGADPTRPNTTYAFRKEARTRGPLGRRARDGAGPATPAASCAAGSGLRLARRSPRREIGRAHV